MGRSARESGPPRFTRRRVLLGMEAGALLVALTACVNPAMRVPTPALVPLLIADPIADRWPAEFHEADLAVQEAYRFAVAHPETRFIPCYCGCVNQNHLSSFDCYVAEETPERLVLSSHAFGCGICVAITHDVMTLEGEAIPLREIRERIDAKWGLAGPGTKTALPPT